MSVLRSPLALAGIAAGLVLLQFLASAVERRTEWAAPVDAAHGAQRGFERTSEGGYRAVASEGDLHELAFPVALRRSRDYELRFVIRAPAQGRVELHVDLYAPGYDHDRQERSLDVGAEAVGRRVHLEIGSGHYAPPSGSVRLFYVGPPDLEVGEIDFRRLSLVRSTFQRIAPLAAGACLLVASWLAIVRTTLSRRETDRAQAPAGWALGAIYLASALGHFAAHLFAPFWSGDEARYRAVASALWQLGRPVPLAADVFAVPIDLPNMLYPFLIAPAFAAGDGFYSAIRLINVLSMCAVVFPTYALARRYLGRPASLFVSALAAALPFVNLAAYAVTEVLFYPLYVAAVWLTLESLLRERRVGWCAAVGVAAAALLNTRPSGIVVIPAFLLCHAWVALRRGMARELVRRPAWTLAPLCFVPVFFALQWLTGVEQIGRPGIYTQTVAQSADLLPNVGANPGGVLDLALGHAATLAIPYALPLALLLVYGLARARAKRDPAEGALHVVSAVFFFALLALTLVFTVAVSGTDLGGLGRWHARYYFSAFPPLIVSAAVLLAKPAGEGAPRARWLWATVAIALGLHIWFMDFRAAASSPWFTSIVDNMDAQWYLDASWYAEHAPSYRALAPLRWPLLAASALLTWLWQRGSRWLQPLVVAFALVWIGIGNLGTAAVMAIGSPVTPDPCGKLLGTFLGLRPGRFAVFGAEQSFRTAAVFWNPYLPEQTLPSERAPLYLATPQGDALDFILSDAELPPDPRYELQVDGGSCRIYARVRR